MLPEQNSLEHIVLGFFVRPSVRPSVSPYVIRVWPITSLFEVGFENYFTEMLTILTRRGARNICFLEGQGHSMTLQQNRLRPITTLFSPFFTEMITIFRQPLL